jgi:hypothetical protein
VVERSQANNPCPLPDGGQRRPAGLMRASSSPRSEARRSLTFNYLFALLLGAAVFVVACSGGKTASTPTATVETAQAAATAVPPPTTVAGPTATPRPVPSPPVGSRPFPPELQAEADRILARVAELRGTPPRAPVAMNLVGRRQAIDYYRNNYDAEAKQQAELQEDVYELLGMLPKGSDIRELFLGLLGLGILGFYDPDQDAFYLLDDLGGLDSVASRTTIVHELAHALQDQYYDLIKLEGERRRNNDWDGITAFLDVIEGDAVATEGAYRNASPRRAACFEIPVVRSVGIPYVIQRELSTWYEDGYCFVEATAPQLNQTAALFENLPVSTEQILHPEKYHAGERPLPVSLVPLEAVLGPGWSEVGRANLGEFSIQNLLVLGMRDDRPRVQSAAAGWGGDGWALYGRDDARLIQLATAWDTTEDAHEFFEVLFASLTSRATATRLPPVREGGFTLQLDSNTWRVAIADNRVTILVSTEASALELAANHLRMP